MISRFGIIGINRERLFEGALGALPVAVQIQLRRGEAVVGFPQRLVETPGGGERHFELAPRFDRMQQPHGSADTVVQSEAEVRLRIVGIQANRAREALAAPMECRGRPPVTEVPAFQA